MARALVITGRGEAPEVRDLAGAAPGDGQVRIAVKAASVNGIDAFVAAGYVWDSMPHRFPVVLGRDFAGTVAAVGNGVADLHVGDEVAGVIGAGDLYLGVIAEEVVVDATLLTIVPEGVTLEQAAGAGLAGITARDLVDALALTPDDVALVSGATGGVGALTVQLAAATGATVIATARPDAEDFVRGLGASAVVDYTGDLASAVMPTAPDGVTAIAHAAGDAALLGGLLRPGGRLGSVIGATTEQVGRADVTVFPVHASPTPAKLRTLLDAIAAGHLEVPVDRTFPLADAAAALSAFGQHKLGKLIIALG